MSYQALHHGEDDHGRPFTILVIEGAANDVAAYQLAGEHDDAAHVLAHGVKMTERAARREVGGWPVRLHYRR